MTHPKDLVGIRVYDGRRITPWDPKGIVRTALFCGLCACLQDALSLP